jgi:hypothetical protein
MSQNDGNIMQLSINANSMMSYLNESHSIKEYNFENYDTLTLPNDCHELIPDYLVLHAVTYYDNIESTMKYVSFSLTIDSEIIKIPLLFLTKLNKPRLFSNKIYLKIPFEIFHEKKIPVIKINNRIVFKIENSQELVDTVLSYSLICKTSFYDINRQNILNNVNVFSEMQNIKSYYIKNNSESVKEVDITLRNVIGITKGVFIECNVNSLIHFRFNINGIERINYDRFSIEEYCTIINPNIIYIPISPNNISYTSFEYNGSLNMGRTRAPLVHMIFNTPQPYIGMHSLYHNKINYTNDGTILQNNYNNSITWNTCISEIALRNIESLVPLNLNPSRIIDVLNEEFIIVNTSSSMHVLNSDGTRSIRQNILNTLTCNMLDYLNNTTISSDSSGNNIVDISGNILYRTDLSGNIIWANNNIPRIVRNIIPSTINENSLTTVINDSSGNNIVDIGGNVLYRTDLSGNIIWVNDSIPHIVRNINPYTLNETSFFGNEIYIYRYINNIDINSNEDYLCCISHEIIKENDKYMECNNCNKKFFELAIKHWLLLNTSNNKTCPNCRSIWSNYNVYINTSTLENI